MSDVAPGVTMGLALTGALDPGVSGLPLFSVRKSASFIQQPQAGGDTQDNMMEEIDDNLDLKTDDSFDD